MPLWHAIGTNEHVGKDRFNGDMVTAFHRRTVLFGTVILISWQISRVFR